MPFQLFLAYFINDKDLSQFHLPKVKWIMFDANRIQSVFHRKNLYMRILEITVFNKVLSCLLAVYRDHNFPHIFFKSSLYAEVTPPW